LVRIRASPKSGEKRLDQTTNNVLKKVLRKPLLLQEFYKNDFEKERKPHPAVEEVILKQVFKKCPF
jgi:hypothetical protein